MIKRVTESFNTYRVGSGVMSQNIWGAQSLRGSEASKPEGA